MALVPSSADVSTMSGERSAMDGDLQLIADIRAGAPAIRARAGQYLPRYEQESNEEYRRRVMVAPWRPEFVDCLRSLASKPFGTDVTLAQDTPETLAALADDIDGSGNNLTRFARHAFAEGIANGVHGILVDYTLIEPVASIAEERAAGARPYWVHVPVSSIVALRTEVLNGREVVTHLRIREFAVEPDGFGERTVSRIKVYEPGSWELWEQSDRIGWVKVDGGDVICNGKPLDEVPLALFFTGERLGALQTRPPLRDLAEIQIELFRAMSRQDEILTYSGSPMLAAVGLSKPGPGDEQIKVGPKTILFAPPVGPNGGSRWEYVSPDAAAIGEIRQQIAAIIQDMRRLGMQPATPAPGGQTATASSIEAAKAHSALVAWAVGLKDVLEHAYQFTARWLGIDHDTIVQVFTDFAAGDQNVDESKLILSAEKAKVLSKQTARDELWRRGILGPQFVPSAEEGRLLAEYAPVEAEEANDPEPPAEVDATLLVERVPEIKVPRSTRGRNRKQQVVLP